MILIAAKWTMLYADEDKIVSNLINKIVKDQELYSSSVWYILSDIAGNSYQSTQMTLK